MTAPSKEPGYVRNYALDWRARNSERISEQNRQGIAELRAMTDSIKLERGCADCGYADHAEALDFDHRPGEHKSRSVSRMVSCRSSVARILSEIEKCDVVCANCHRVRTAWRRHG